MMAPLHPARMFSWRKGRVGVSYRGASRPARYFALTPEILETIRRQLVVAHRVLDVLVAEPSLQRPRIVTGICQCIAAGVAQHVRKDREGHTSTLAQARE